VVGMRKYHNLLWLAGIMLRDPEMPAIRAKRSTTTLIVYL